MGVSEGFEPLMNRIGADIRLRSTKIDGWPHFAWTCRVLCAAPDVVVLHQAAGMPITTWNGVWTPDCDARIYFWRDRWFNVIQSWHTDGSLKEYYCNVITPARVVDDELHWNDLDLDVSVQADGTYRILDEDEWARNIERLVYVPELVAGARRAMDELITSVERRAFPFNALAGSLLDEIEPLWHVHEYHETIVNAPPNVVYDAMMALPVGASTVMRVLMGLRGLPARLIGRRTRRKEAVHNEALIAAMRRQGFVLLGERPGAEIVLGLAGRFWQAAPSGVRLNGREDFMRYEERGAARASINFRVEPLSGGRTRVSTETRVRCFGGAERKFKVYWAFIGPFSAWIRRDWLRLIKRSSESASQ